MIAPPDLLILCDDQYKYIQSGSESVLCYRQKVFMRFLFCDIIYSFHFLRFDRPYIHVWLIDRKKYLSAFAKTTSTLDDLINCFSYFRSEE